MSYLSGLQRRLRIRLRIGDKIPLTITQDEIISCCARLAHVRAIAMARVEHKQDVVESSSDGACLALLALK